MKYQHVEEVAALYALGALSDDERAAVDTHLFECDACARIVGEAERDVTAIVSNEPQRNAPAALEARITRLVQPRRIEPIVGSRPFSWRLPAWGYPATIAAALVLGLMPSAYLFSANRNMHEAMVAQNSMIGRLAGAPHRTAHFHPMQAGPPADVMYASNGSWYVVVVHDASKLLSVAWMHDGVNTMLGHAVPKGNVAILYLPKSHRMDRLALMDGDRVVGEATLSWQNTVALVIRERP